MIITTNYNILVSWRFTFIYKKDAWEVSVWSGSNNQVTSLEGFFLTVLPCKSLSRS